MSQPQLLVMAAGIGSRYGGLKQIDPVGPSGEIVIEYAIYDALKAGFGKVVFTIRKEIEEVFREKIGKTIEKQVDTEYVFQELDKLPPGLTVPADRTKPWGTGHAILCAREAIDAPFAVINADDFYGADAYRLLCDYLKNARDTDDKYDYSMVGYVLGNTLTEYGHVARGVCDATDDGFLARVVERTKVQKFGDVIKYTGDDENWTEIDGGNVVSLNMWGFTQSVFGELEQRFPKFVEENMDKPKAEFYIPTVVDELIQEGKAAVKILPTDEKWFGVTYKEDKPRLKEVIANLVNESVYPKKLWA